MPKVKCIEQHITDRAAIYQGDCIELVRALPDNSIDFVCSSIPFSDQYTYSNSDHDLGNNLGDDGFWQHMSHLLPELHRVMVPGRLVALHVKDRLRYKNKWGSGGLNPFSDETTIAMRAAGFQFHCRITVATDPVRELQQTKRHGLRYMDIKEAASTCGPGMPEYLMLYRKWDGLGDTSYSPRPVQHDPDEYTLRRWQLEANAIWQTDGHTALPLYDHEARVSALESGYDLTPPPAGMDAWVRGPFLGGKYKGPEIHTPSPFVWPDIDRMRTLNYAVAKESQDEKHICPLQLDLIERAIRLWSSPGDVVFDPFAGIGSVPVTAIRMGRRALGTELKASYYRFACKYVDEAARLASVETLFDQVTHE